jgi:hypothetical protein
MASARRVRIGALASSGGAMNSPVQNRQGDCAPITIALDRRSPCATAADLGMHGLTAALIAIQLGIVAVSLPLYSLLGLTVVWSTALPVAWVALALTTAWLYYYSAPGRSHEWIIPESLVVFLLLLLLGVTVPPAQYAAAALNRPVIDPALAAADALVGIDVRELTAWTREHPMINAVLIRAYFTLLWQFLLIVPMLGILQERVAMWEYAFHFHVCSVITLLVFALFPAECAFSHLGFASTINQTRFLEHFHGVRAGTLRVLQFGQLEGLVSMPSFHVAGAMMVTWACRRRRWLLIPLLAINITLAVATFMTGAHYVVDTLGTAAMFAGSIWLWRNWGVHMLRARLTRSEAQT